MSKNDTVRTLARVKEKYNHHFFYIYENYPELAWRLKQIDASITQMENVIDDLIQNLEAAAAARTSAPQIGQLLETQIDTIILQSYESL